MTAVFEQALGTVASLAAVIDKTGRITRIWAHDTWVSTERLGALAKKKWRDVFVPVDPFGRALVPGGQIRPGTRYLTLFEGRFLEWRFSPLQGEAGEGRGLIGAGVDVSSHILNARQLQDEKNTLLGQNKELKCLYGIGRVLGSASLSLPQKLQGLVSLLPPAFQYPEHAGARIIFDGTEYTTASADEGQILMAETLKIEGRDRGSMAVFYPAGLLSQEAVKGLFARGEKFLLRTAVQQLSMMLEKEESEALRRKMEQQLQHADRLATVGQLSAGMAHELNGPLNNILGFAQLAAKQQDLPEQVYSDLDNIVRFSLHTREIVKKVMLFSRQMVPCRELISLDSVIQEGIRFTEPLCRKSGIKVSCRVEENLPRIQADPSQLHQVMINLIVNAAQAMPAQGGTIFIHAGGDGDAGLVMTIRDTGTGMTQEVLAKCFLPFFTTKDVDKGTGLGLSVVHGIVESHGGTIEAKSDPGQGVCFTIRLPAHPEQGGSDV